MRRRWPSRAKAPWSSGATSAVDSVVDEVRRAGGEMIALAPGDLTDLAAARALVDLVLGEHGRVDVLFNNAVMAHFNWLEDISDAEWDKNRREEVDLVFYLTRAGWPHLKASHGVVVNTASLNAHMSFGALPSLAHTTAKAGIIAMTRPPAMEGRAFGIRVNPFRRASSRPTRPVNS